MVFNEIIIVNNDDINDIAMGIITIPKQSEAIVNKDEIIRGDLTITIEQYNNIIPLIRAGKIVFKRTLKLDSMNYANYDETAPYGESETLFNAMYDDINIALDSYGDAYSGDVNNKADRNELHDHGNLVILDEIGKNAEGQLTFNGNKVDLLGAPDGVYDGLDSTDNTASLSANMGRVLNINKLDKTATAINSDKLDGHSAGEFAGTGHLHDDRYYTKSTTDTKLAGKSDTSHTHDDRYYTETEIDDKLNYTPTSTKTDLNDSEYFSRPKILTPVMANLTGGIEGLDTTINWRALIETARDFSVAYSYYTQTLTVVPNTSGDENSRRWVRSGIMSQTPHIWEEISYTSHVHDDRYYTETEIDDKLAGKSDTSHTHDSRYFIKNGYIERTDPAKDYFVGAWKDNDVYSYNWTNPIFTIGSEYKPTAESLVDMYGIGYAQGDAPFLSNMDTNGWGMYVSGGGQAGLFLDSQNGNGQIFDNVGVKFSKETHIHDYMRAFKWTLSQVSTPGHLVTPTGDLASGYTTELCGVAISDTEAQRAGEVDIVIENRSSGSINLMRGIKIYANNSHTSSIAMIVSGDTNGHLDPSYKYVGFISSANGTLAVDTTTTVRGMLCL